MTISFKKSDPKNLTSFKRDYYAQLTSPLDGMWESFTNMAEHYSISTEGHYVGYLALNNNQQLLQFYYFGENVATDVFHQAINELGIKGAVVHTFEETFLSLAFDQKKSSAVNAIQYHMPETMPVTSPSFPEGCQFKLTTEQELDSAVDFALDALGAPKDWLIGYYSERIERNELFCLWLEDRIIGAGECRKSPTQQNIADIGMVIAKGHRKKGLATNILRALLNIAKEKGYHAICSTEASNIGAQKAILKSGFTSKHRIIEFKF